MSFNYSFNNPAKAVKNIQSKKIRANMYDEKLAIKGTFADVFKVLKNNKEEKKRVYDKFPFYLKYLYICAKVLLWRGKKQ